MIFYRICVRCGAPPLKEGRLPEITLNSLPGCPNCGHNLIGVVGEEQDIILLQALLNEVNPKYWRHLRYVSSDIKERAYQRLEELKARVKLRNRQIRDLRRQLRK